MCLQSTHTHTHTHHIVKRTHPPAQTQQVYLLASIQRTSLNSLSSLLGSHPAPPPPSFTLHVVTTLRRAASPPVATRTRWQPRPSARLGRITIKKLDSCQWLQKMFCLCKQGNGKCSCCRSKLKPGLSRCKCTRAPSDVGFRCGSFRFHTDATELLFSTLTLFSPAQGTVCSHFSSLIRHAGLARVTLWTRTTQDPWLTIRGEGNPDLSDGKKLI